MADAPPFDPNQPSEDVPAAPQVAAAPPFDPSAPSENAPDQADAPPMEASAPPFDPSAPSEDVPAASSVEKPRELSGKDLDTLAAKHGTDPRWLRGVANYFDARYVPEQLGDVGEQATQAGKRFAGYAGELLPVNPSGLWKKLGSLTPEQRRTLDDLQHEVSERESGGEKALKFAGSLVLPIGVAGKVPKAYRTAATLAEGAGLGGAGAYGHSREGHEVQDTLVGSAIGLGLGALGSVAGHYAPAALKHLRSDRTEAITEAATDAEAVAAERLAANSDGEAALKDAVLSSPDLRKAVRSGDRDAFRAALPAEDMERIAALSSDTEGSVVERAMGVVDEATTDLTRAARRRADGVASYGEKEGSQALSDLWDRQRRGSYLKEHLAEDAERLAGERPGAIRKAMSIMADARYVYGAADERLGTRLVPALDDVSAGLNHFSDEIASAGLAQKPLHKELLSVEKANPGFSLFDAMEGRAHPSTEQEEHLVQSWHDAFEARRQRAEELGVPITKLEGGYVPHMMVEPVEAVRRIESRIEDRSPAGLEALVERAKAGDEHAADTVKGLEAFTGETIEDATSASRALRALDDPAASGAGSGTRARFGEQRTDSIPHFLLETDVPKLLARWTANTYRHAYLRGPLQELASRADAIKEQAPEVAGYIERHIRDLSGVRPGTIADATGRASSAMQVQLARAAGAAEAAGQPIKAQALRLATKLPDMVSSMAQNMNVYALGLRPTTGLKILLQPYSYSLPTLGSQAARDFTLATADAVKAAMSGNMKSEFAEVVSRGLSPQKLPLEAGRWISEGLERSPVRRWAANAQEALNSLALWQYRNSHMMARIVSLKASQRLMGRMFEEPSLARSVLARIEEPGYQRVISEAMTRGDRERAENLMAQYVNGSTQFNFDRAGMSEYGRTMGSLFSTFTKVPLTVLSDFAKSADRISRSKQMTPELTRLTMKYLAPALSFYALEKAVAASGVREDHPAIGAALPKNFAKVPPFEATGKISEMSPLSAPLPHAVAELAKVISEGDEVKAKRALAELTAPALPGSAWLRFFLSDAPRYLGQETKSNPIEELEDRLSE